MNINEPFEELLERFGSKIEPDKNFEAGGEVPQAVASREVTLPPLFNMGEPACDLQREKPIHRKIALLKAAGLKNVEIADMCGVTPVMVAYVVKQPFAQAIILGEMHGAVDAAMQKLHNASVQAAEKLITIMQTASNQEVARKAAEGILDRKFGKPNQPYSVQAKSPDQMSDQELVKVIQSQSN